MLRLSANENAIRNAFSQSLSFPAPLDKGNVDSGNEIAYVDTLRNGDSPPLTINFLEKARLGAAAHGLRCVKYRK